MLELCTLASGSSGNCLLVSDGATHILVDAGISCRRITAALGELGVGAGELAAVVVTHEHSDHISGLTTLLKRFPLPVYASRGTALQLRYRIPFVEELLHPFEPGTGFALGEVEVGSFPTPHDAAQSTGYTFTRSGRKAAVVTDLGWVTPQVEAGVRGAGLLVAESNHDEDWLRNGGYPPFLKQRILSREGHLSNEAGAALACRAVAEGAHTVVLAHLSRENNTPQRAYETAQTALEAMGAAVGRDVELAVAPPDRPGRRYRV